MSMEPDRSSSVPVTEEYLEEELHARFQVSTILGKGAYGTVYKALDRTNDTSVAIKVIPLTEQDKEDFKQIQREIAFLADCNHPNVVRYLGSYRHRSELWIAMEYCGGGSVSDLMQATNAQLSEDIIAHICCESLKGLAYLHALSKIHRDIKCGNILLSDTGEVKIADFGVSAQLTHTMSKRQTFIGTPHWMAPEVIKESRYDCKVDVWALGICAIEMAEMVPPRWAVHPLRVIFMISRDPAPKLTDHDKWSPVFHDFLAQALLKDPKMRPSARYLLQHRFVVGQRTGAPPSLLPLIARTQQYLASHSGPQALASTVKGVANVSTGKFDWHGGTVAASNFKHAGPDSRGDTVLAGAGAESPHSSKPPALLPAPPKPKLLPVLASPPASTRTSNNGSSATMVAYGDTTVFHDDSLSSNSPGRGTLHVIDASASLVVDTEPGPSSGGGYMAAVKAAAADAHKERGGMTSPDKPSGPQTPKNELDKAKERVHAMYEGGLVLHAPFLKAAHVQPLALLNPSSRPSCTPSGRTGGVDGVDGDAHAVLLQLVQRSAAWAGQGSRDASCPDSLPANLIRQVMTHPELQNLARTLAYHQRSQQLLPLDKAAGAQLQRAVDDVSDMLHCTLCL
ncbi:MAG: hypothetical protein WDW38_001571 [Sanguina aurantia]